MGENQGHFRYNGQLKGHGGWVTSIAAPIDTTGSLISGSRDCSVIQWEIAPDSSTGVYGYAKRRMDGHSNFVQDVQISSDGQFGLSGAWDNSLRLWDLSNGASTCRFMGHSKDVMSVAFSPDNRQIISGSRDNTMKMWNTLGENKFTIDSEGHKDWVSCTRFSPNPQTPLIVSCGWDKMVKVWSLNNLGLQSNLAGHTGYWLCAATGSAIKIWDLESKQTVAELVPELPEMGKRAMKPECISLAWSADGSTLYSGYTDNTIRVWGVHA